MTTPLRVIVVDDRLAVRESLCTILTLEDDIQVVGEASSGRQAVNLVQNVSPDLVLMDYEMPDELEANFDGIEACRAIKEENTPPVVIVLTIHSEQQSRLRAKEAGCDLFSGKRD